MDLEGGSRSIPIACGATGLIGCAAVVAANLIGSVLHEGHSLVGDTISMLAAGQFSWIQDLGFYLLAAGLLSCGVGIWRWGLGGLGWKLGSLALLLLSIDVVLIGAFNEYAGKRNSGADIHQICTIALGVLFFLAMLLIAPGLSSVGKSWGRFSWRMAMAWAILAPLFYFVPSQWIGAYERFLGLLLVVWLGTLCWLLLQWGRGELPVLQSRSAEAGADELIWSSYGR